jgi:pilus assembly protein Flp/PilA
VAARLPLVLGRAGAKVRNRTHVTPLEAIAAVGPRSVAQRLRLHTTSARLSRGGVTVNRTHGNLRAVNGARRNVMNLLINRLRTFARNEEAQDLIEYALLVGLISLVAVGAVTLAGGSVNTIFSNIAARLASAA